MTRYTERRIAGYYEDDGSEPGWPPGRGPAPRGAEEQVAEEPTAEFEQVEAEQVEEQDAEDEENGEKLPGRHAGLDALAAERGYQWSADELTIRQKREELAALE